jgi:hypothetical protein
MSQKNFKKMKIIVSDSTEEFSILHYFLKNKKYMYYIHIIYYIAGNKSFLIINILVCIL